MMKSLKNLLKRFYLFVIKERSGDVFYINGPDTLPPPLSKQEEAEAFEKLMKHDDSAREKLIVHNLRLVVYIAKK